MLVISQIHKIARFRGRKKKYSREKKGLDSTKKKKEDKEK